MTQQIPLQQQQQSQLNEKELVIIYHLVHELTIPEKRESALLDLRFVFFFPK